jgi:TonB family protein
MRTYTLLASAIAHGLLYCAVCAASGLSIESAVHSGVIKTSPIPLVGSFQCGGDLLPSLRVPTSAAAQATSTPAKRIHKTLVRGTKFVIEGGYPALARQARIQGTVTLEGVIGTSGLIQELRVISGHPLLVATALNVVKDRRFGTTSVKGEPVEVITTFTVVFRITDDTERSPRHGHVTGI